MADLSPGQSPLSPEALFHWLVGVLLAALSGGATWIIKTVLRHEQEIAVIETKQSERHDENLRRLDRILDDLDELKRK